MSDAAWDRFIETMRSNQQTYYASISEKEREAHRKCECGLCVWIRSVDEMIATYDAEKRV